MEAASALSPDQNHWIILDSSLFPQHVKPSSPKHVLDASPFLHLLGILCKPKPPSFVRRPLPGVPSVPSSHCGWRNLFKQPYSGTIVLIPASNPVSYGIQTQIPSVTYEFQSLCSSPSPNAPLCYPHTSSLFLFLFLASRPLHKIFPPLGMVFLRTFSWFTSHHSFLSFIILALRRSSLTSLCKVRTSFLNIPPLSLPLQLPFITKVSLLIWLPLSDSPLPSVSSAQYK